MVFLLVNTFTFLNTVFRGVGVFWAGIQHKNATKTYFGYGIQGGRRFFGLVFKPGIQTPILKTKTMHAQVAEREAESAAQEDPAGRLLGRRRRSGRPNDGRDALHGEQVGPRESRDVAGGITCLRQTI